MRNEGLSLPLRSPCRWRCGRLLGGLRLGMFLFVATTIALRAAGQAPGPNRSPDSSARNVTIATEPVARVVPAANAGLFVGVNEFHDDPGLNPLHFAVHDAIELAHLFVFHLRLIPAENCVLLLAGKPTSPVVKDHLKQLLDAGARQDAATRNSIFAYVTQACNQQASETNLLVVVMSSHGFSEAGTAYVMPSDGRKATLKRTAVSLAEVEEDIERKSKAGHRLLFIDACQQRFGAKAVGAPASGPGMDKEFHDAFLKETGQYKLASCSPRQLSYESGELGGGVGHGVFSHALLEALRGGALPDANNLIRLKAVEKYVSNYVAQWTKQSMLEPQTPFHAGSLDSLNLPLAKRPDDLQTLLSSMKGRQPTETFTADLQKRLVKLLERLRPPLRDRDEDFLRKVRGFIEGETSEDLFVPYLEKQLVSREPQPPPPLARPQSVTLTVLGANQYPTIGAWVELLWRANAEDKPQVVGEGASDAKGRCEIRSPKHEAGIFSAIAWRGVERSEETRLDMFPSQSNWTLQLSASDPRDRKPGQLHVNSMGMRFAYIPPGRFLMGKTHDEASQFADDKPHEVRLTRGFFLGVYEVTQQEFQRIMNKNPSYFSAQGNGADLVRGMDTSRFPVEDISWQNAKDACDALSALERRQYRLPTEAEWEYACRAGTTTPFFWGQSLNGDRANCDGKNYPFGTVIQGTYLERTTTVGSYQANAWGLFDMHGNVWELCADWRDPNYYANSPLNDPPGPVKGTSKIRRGGSWRVPAVYCQSAHRNWNVPNATRSDPESPPDIGFRVLLEVPSPAP